MAIWRQATLIFLIALLVRGLSAMAIRQPGYMDAYYYYHVAQNLYRGRGFVEDMAWNYLTPLRTIPQPSNAYWMPLVSVLIYLSFLIFGAGFRAAQIPSLLFSGALPALAYVMGRDLFGAPRYAYAMAFLTLFSGVLFLYWVVPDNFAPFAFLGALTLMLLYKSLRGSLWFLAAAGATAGLAHLARPDGVLLLLVAEVCALLTVGRHRRGPLLLLLPLSAYLLVMAPWLWRNLVAFGTPFPLAGAKTIFLTEYNDIFSYGKELSLQSYLAWGWWNILRSKMVAGTENLLHLGELLLFYMLPFALVGLYLLRRRLEYLPFFLYITLLYISMSFLFTFPGPRGGFLHSAGVLLPFLAGAVLMGLDASVQWASRWLRHWNVVRAQRNLTIIMVAFSALASLGFLWRASLTWDERYLLYENLASWLSANSQPGELAMLADPPGYFYSSGKPSLVSTNNDLETTLEVAHRFGVRFLVVETAHPWPWHGLYLQGESEPSLQLRQTLDGMKIYEVIQEP